MTNLGSLFSWLFAQNGVGLSIKTNIHEKADYFNRGRYERRERNKNIP
jgi:hypothetical protein